MKKIFIMIMCAILLAPILTIQDVKAATYNEANDFTASDDGNGTIGEAEYIPLENFTVEQYTDPQYGYSSSYNTVNIIGYGEDTDSSGYDYYGFYIPYDTRLRINTSKTYSNDEVIENELIIKLYAVNKDKETDITTDDLYTGVNIKSGYYVIGVEQFFFGDSIDRPTNHSLFWHHWTSIETYYNINYGISIRYTLKPGDSVDTSSSLYQNKLDGIAASLWTNDFNLEGVEFVNDDEGDKFVSDYVSYMGYDSSSVNDLNQFYETGILDKRLYILSEEMRVFTLSFLTNFLITLEEAKNMYEQKISEGILGIGNWNYVLGISEENAQATEDALMLIFDMLEMPPGVGGFASAVECAVESGVEYFEYQQYIIMIQTIHTLMNYNGQTIDDLNQNPQIYSVYFDLFDRIFGDMISDPSSLGESITLIESLKSSLYTYGVYSNGNEDNYMYIDFVSTYSYLPAQPVPLAYDVYGHIEELTYTNPKITKTYNLRQFEVEGTTYPYMILSGSNDASEKFWSELNPNTLISEEIEYKGTVNKGTLTYCNRRDYDLSKRDLSITATQSNNYGTTVVNDNVEVINYIPGIKTTDRDKILNNLYALDTMFGFMQINYIIGNKEEVSRETYPRYIKLTYQTIITFYVSNPTYEYTSSNSCVYGDSYMIECFYGVITENVTIYKNSGGPGIKPIISIEMM